METLPAPTLPSPKGGGKKRSFDLLRDWKK
jgi:hypothetical protein